MRIRIAFLLVVAVLGVVLAVGVASLIRPPIPTVVAPIELETDDGPGKGDGKKGEGKPTKPADNGGGASTVPAAPVPAGDDDDDDDGPNDSDDDDDSDDGGSDD